VGFCDRSFIFPGFLLFPSPSFFFALSLVIGYFSVEVIPPHGSLFSEDFWNFSHPPVPLHHPTWAEDLFPLHIFCIECLLVNTFSPPLDFIFFSLCAFQFLPLVVTNSPLSPRFPRVVLRPFAEILFVK